jgi:hypothetical protein
LLFRQHLVDEVAMDAPVSIFNNPCIRLSRSCHLAEM